MRHGIEAVEHLDMVVGMHLGLLPLGILKGRIGQGPQCGMFYLCKEVLSGAAHPPHRARIEICKQLGNGHVQRLYGKELPVAQPGQDSAFHDQDCALDLALIAGLARPRWQNGRVVMRGHVRKGLGHRRLEPQRLGHCRLEIVADDCLGHATKELQRPNLGIDPVGQLLAEAGPGESVIGGAKHGDEDLGAVLVACRRVNDQDSVAGVIGLHHRASLMAVAVPGTDPGLELPVTRAEPRVAIPVGVGRPIFLPEKQQRHALALHLGGHLWPVGFRQVPRGATNALKHDLRQRRIVIASSGKRPAVQPCFPGPVQVCRHGRLAELQPCCNLTRRQTLLMRQSQHGSYVLHSRAPRLLLSRHSPSRPCSRPAECRYIAGDDQPRTRLPRAVRELVKSLSGIYRNACPGITEMHVRELPKPAAMARAQDLGQDPFAALDADVGWETLLGKRDEIAGFGELATSDPLALAAERYAYMRKFAPAFLDAFEFKATDAGDDLKDAIALLRDQNRTGKRKLPDDPPMPFAAKHWPSLIIQDGRPQRRVYETAVVSTLRERLRAGDVWVDGSREYRRFDSYLKPRGTAEIIMRDAGFETDPDAWLSDRRATMAKRLEQVDSALTRKALPGARIERGRLKITPHDAVTPPAAVRLERAIDAVMPRIRITELLWEVNAQTGFLDAFTDLRSGKQHDEPATVLATVLAGATNLGLEQMAHASSRLSHAQLTWAQTWYLRPETFADALGRIVDAHHGLPFAQHWGAAEHSSSDGQFFAANRGSGLINAKYGPDPGLKIYSFLSGQYGSFHSRVIGATAGEAPFVLDGLLSNPASFDPLVHYTDTGGVSDHVFAMFHLLGMTFAPRLRDFPDRRLACFGSAKAWPSLSPLIGKPINEEVIRQHWGDIMRLAASIRDKSLKPSEILR